LCSGYRRAPDARERPARVVAPSDVAFAHRNSAGSLPFNPRRRREEAIAHLNDVHVLAVAIAGFVRGCLWSHRPPFGEAGRAQMKLAPESMAAAIQQLGKATLLIKDRAFPRWKARRATCDARA
jgi:hypothetical protein